MSVQQLNVRADTKTKDNVFVTLVIAVQYEVVKERTYDAFYRLTNPAHQINAFVYDVVRATVPKLELDACFEEKDHIAKEVRAQLAVQMEEFGFFIRDALVIDIDPDQTVKDAMNEINASRRQRIAAQERAEAEKILFVKRAEADAQSKFLAGEGVARQRKAIAEGLRNSVNDFTKTANEMNAKDVMEMLLLTQHFDTLKELGHSQGGNTIFVPHNPGALNDVTKEIRKLAGRGEEMRDEERRDES